jgi:hypothetical protein
MATPSFPIIESFLEYAPSGSLWPPGTGQAQGDIALRRGELKWALQGSGPAYLVGPSGERMCEFGFPSASCFLQNAQASVSLGCLVNPDGYISSSSVAFLYSQSTNVFTTQVTIVLNFASGSFQVWKGSPGQGGSVLIYSSSNGLFNSLTPLWLDFYVLPDPAAGAFAVAIDGETIVSLSGQSTGLASVNSIDEISFGTNVYFGDLYIDTAGLIGPSRANAVYWPTADDVVTWVASTGGNNYVDVDTPTQTTNWNQSTVAGDADTFSTAGTIPSSETIKAATVMVLAWKDDTEIRQIQIIIKVGGTTYASGDTITLSMGPTWYSFTWKDNPATSAPWAVSDLNAAKIGYQLIA